MDNSPCRSAGYRDLDVDASIHFPGQVLISFLVEDLDKFIVELRSKGVKVDEPKNTHLGMRSILLRDPDGYIVAIQEATADSPEWLKDMIK